MIKVKSIARIMIKVENLEKAVAFYEKVLGAKFFLKEERDLNSPNGMICAMATEPGLELMEIVGDKGDISMFEKHPGGPKVFEYFRDHAPGVVGVVFDMEGVEEAKEIASRMGIESQFEFNFSDEQMAVLGWDYSKYLEYFLDPTKTDNMMALISEFRPK